MVGETTVGPGSTVEQILDEYDLGASSVVGDLVESDTDRLLLALLLEQRGDSSLQTASVQSATSDQSGSGSSSDGYFSGTIQSVEKPADDDNQPIEPDFEVSTVSVRSFSSPIYVAFDEPTAATDRIQLVPDDGDEPFIVSPGNGWTTDEIYVGVPDGGSATSVTIDAFE